MNTKYLVVVVAAMTVMLVASTAFATTDSVFAGKNKYGKSQASSQANACGNGEISVANFCQDIGAQNQGEENSVAQGGNQEINIDISRERPPVPPVEVGCPEETVWDITIRGEAEEGGVPIGTVICLFQGLGP